MILRKSWTWSAIPNKSTWFVAAVFAFCVAPTFISYKPYRFAWDDAEYLVRSIAVSQALWHGSRHDLYLAMVSTRPPMMTFMGLPWGALASWDAAGKCFLTLAAMISALASLCFYLLLRIGIKPIFLAASGACVFAAMGPYPLRGSAHGPFPPGPNCHFAATAFLADSFFAWTCLAALLLISYEARTQSASTRNAVLRGLLWGSIFSLGALTKLDFLYFIILILPVVSFLRVRNNGTRNFLVTFAAFVFPAIPVAFYLSRWGRLAFWNARAASFGQLAAFSNISLSEFIGETIRESPGIVAMLLFTLCALAYLAMQRRNISPRADWLPFVIAIGFGLIALATANKQIRYVFPALVSLPFLTGILLSGKGQPVPPLRAILAAGLVFCGLVVASVPMRHRPDRKTLDDADAVLAQAGQCNAKRIVLATDSPTLNIFLLELATEVSAAGEPDSVSTLAYNFMYSVPIDDDFRKISGQDEVIFQNSDLSISPSTNERVPEYERFVRQNRYRSFRVGNDMTVYSMRCDR